MSPQSHGWSKEIIPKKFSIDPKNDLQILAPLHRGIGGIGNLNDQLRDTLNPTGATQVMGSLLFGKVIKSFRQGTIMTRMYLMETWALLSL